MTKSEIIDTIAADAGITKAQATKALDSLTTTIQKTVKKQGKLTVTGVGTFSKAKRKARTGVSKLGGVEKQWSSPAHNTVSFKVAKPFKDALN